MAAGAKSPVAEFCRRLCPTARTRILRVGGHVELTPAGRDSLITRIEEDPDKNVERWKKLPYSEFQDPGQPKPGAVVLAN